MRTTSIPPTRANLVVQPATQHILQPSVDNPRSAATTNVKVQTSTSDAGLLRKPRGSNLGQGGRNLPSLNIGFTDPLGVTTNGAIHSCSRFKALSIRSTTRNGSSPAPQSRPRISQREVVTNVSGNGIALLDGNLFAWNPQSGGWYRSHTGEDGIKSLKLGANNSEIWALANSGNLAIVRDDGSLSPVSRTTLPDTSTDFAVSPGGSIAYINAGQVSIRFPGADAAIALNMPDGMNAPHSVAITNDGQLYVLSESNRLCAISLRDAAEHAKNAEIPNVTRLNWQEIAIGATHVSSSERQTGAAESAGPNYLSVLPDGRLGACINQQLLKYENRNWIPAGQGGPTAIEAQYASIPAAKPWATTFLNKFNASGLRYSLPGNGNGDVPSRNNKTLKNELAIDFAQLGRVVASAATAGGTRFTSLAPQRRTAIENMLHPAPGAGVDGNASRALDILEANFDKLPKNASIQKLNNPDHNAIQALYTFRRRILGRNDEDNVGRRLRALLHANVCIPISNKEFAIPVGKMVHDHACLMQAIQEPQQDRFDLWSRRIDGVVRGDTASNLVSTLFKAGIYDQVTYERLSDASMSASNSLQQKNLRLVRQLQSADTSVAGEVADRLAAAVNSLRPNNEALSLVFSSGAGFDLEGLWAFFNVDAQTVGLKGPNVISFNAKPILTPIATGFKTRDIGVDIARTEKGLRITLSETSGTSASASLRFQWRFGGASPAYKNVVTLIGVAGFEAAPVVGASANNTKRISLEFEHDDNGTLHELVRELCEGNVDLEKLLKSASEVTNSDGQTRKLKGEVYAHGFVAGRALYGQDRSDIAQGLYLGASNLLVPALDQVSVSNEWAWSNSHSRDTNGRKTFSSNATSTGSIDFNHISVLDVSTWISSNIDPQRGSSTQLQWKVPLFLGVWSKNLWSNNVSLGSANAHFQADGQLTGASVTLLANASQSHGENLKASISGAPTEGQLTKEKFPSLEALTRQLPGIDKYISILNNTAGARPAVTLELTTAALDTLRAQLLALPRRGSPEAQREQINRMTAEALSNPANLRITNIDLHENKSTASPQIAAFGPLRHINSQSMSISKHSASITISYRGNDAVEFKVAGSLLLGDAEQPESKQIFNISRYDPETINGVIQREANPFQAMLAQRIPEGRQLEAASIENDRAAVFASNADDEMSIAAGALCMLDGSLFYRPRSAQAGELVQVPLSIQQEIMQDSLESILHLMAARASGVLRNGPTKAQEAALSELPRTQRQAVSTEYGFASGQLNTAINIFDILNVCRNTGEDIDAKLNPAQKLVLETFLPANAPRPDAASPHDSAHQREGSIPQYSVDNLRRLLEDRDLYSVFKANVLSQQRRAAIGN